MIAWTLVGIDSDASPTPNTCVKGNKTHTSHLQISDHFNCQWIKFTLAVKLGKKDALMLSIFDYGLE